MAKPELVPAAEQLYVEQLMNVADIAARLGVAEKTVRNWKSAGGWDEKRARVLGTDAAISNRIAQIAVRCAAIIEDMLQRNEVPPRHLFSFLLSYGAGAERARKYEEISAPPADTPAQNGVPSPEALRKAMEELGLESPKPPAQ
ncbi:MAG: hypothetical protein HY962_07095 [Ignavibacteriae bacterium]|nr:hypothetical protein [Ignavibacteriota bacterium]